MGRKIELVWFRDRESAGVDPPGSEAQESIGLSHSDAQPRNRSPSHNELPPVVSTLGPRCAKNSEL
jgi:hypothetical protein